MTYRLVLLSIALTLYRIRTKVVFFGVAIAILGAPLLRGQLAPFAPSLPTDSKQCVQFAKDTADFFSKMPAEHEQCLADHKADQKETDNKDGYKCSRWECQHLHDLLYGDAQKKSSEAVDECYKHVREEAENRAKREKEDRDREEYWKKRDEQSAQRSEASRERRLELERQEKRDKDATTSDSAKDQGDRTAPQVHDEEHEEKEKQETPAVAPRAQDIDNLIRREADARLQKDSAPSQAKIVDPFAGPTRADGSQHPRQEAGLVDPFSTGNRATQKEKYEVSKETLLASFEKGEAVIDRDMRTAQKTLTGRRLEQYMAESKDLKQMMGGMSKLLVGMDYGASAVSIYKASDGAERSRATSEFATKFVSDVSRYGAKAVVTHLFPKAAAVLAGPVGWVATVGSEVLTSTETSRDSTESIRDHSGNVSLAEKQEALYQQLRAYDRFGSTWGQAGKLELLENIRVVSQLEK